MLILSRKAGQRINLAGNVVVVVQAIFGKRAQIGTEAPQDIRILRGELESRQKPRETKRTP